MLLNSTQVPNTLLKAIIEHEFTEKEVAFLLFLCRKTIGWNEETQWMTRQYIQTALKISSENHVSELVKSLEKKEAIKRIPNPKGSGWLFSLNERRWTLEHEIEESTNQDSESPEIGTHSITIRNQVPGDFSKSHERVISKEEPNWGGEGEKLEPRTRSKAKYPNARTAYSWLPDRQPSWDVNTTELIHGEMLFKRGEEAVRKFVRYVRANEDNEDFNWTFVKPSDYERKWPEIQKYAKRNS